MIDDYQGEEFIKNVCSMGATKAAIVPVVEIVLDRSFRGVCEQNSCGMYGKCWQCPPDAGDIDILMDRVRSYLFALVYQLVGDVEDSYDFEGMQRVKQMHVQLALRIRKEFEKKQIRSALHLGSGGCGVCHECAKRHKQACRFPELAMSSLEAYGIYVSHLAQIAGMNYINGENTVTYFGAVLF